MTTFKGIVNTVLIRDDGWVEVIGQAVHAGNTTITLFIKDLDGDITMAHKRLGQLSLLRDAVTRVLPVEIDYEADPAQGNLITEVMVHPRPSIDGRTLGSQIQGIVIGISIAEIEITSGASPYLDPPDLAGITLLKEDGNVVNLLLDLQREEKLTMHAMLKLLQTAHKTRRPVIVTTSIMSQKGNDGFIKSTFYNSSSINNQYVYIENCQWVTVPEELLTYSYAFIERLSERYESYTVNNVPALYQVNVTYTTAPAQTPEGDISDNGSFHPVTQSGWIHDDSPLLKFLKLALKKRLQVKLGMLDNQIHEVEVISHLGSAARPIWICVKNSILQNKLGDTCSNTPTIQSPSNNPAMQNAAFSMMLKGQAYFNEGIWRFQVNTSIPYQLIIDCRAPCCSSSDHQCHCCSPCQNEKDCHSNNTSCSCCCTNSTCQNYCNSTNNACCNCKNNSQNTNDQNTQNEPVHLYLKGVHNVKLILCGYHAAEPFELLIYRIR